MNKNSLGIYIHVPFCIQKCRYCDFCSFPSDSETKERYIGALIKQILHAPADKREVQSIFFGGGTPSLLSGDQFSAVFSALREKFSMAENVEITVESNPGTLSREKLSVMRSLGVNRISMGVQSAIDSELLKLGRIHTFSEFLESYRMAEEVGFENLNVDLMYGIPGQSVNSFKQTLERIVALSPTHISAYGLIIEEGTPFGRERDTLNLPSEEEEAEMYSLACETLGKEGYLHYEISNYAKPGYVCKHNLRYWQGGDYLGFGIAAHSLYCGERYSVTENIEKYISNPKQVVNRSAIDPITEREEFVMLSLRTSVGLSLEEYRERFSKDLFLEKKERIELYQSLGYMEMKDGRLSFTEKGFYLSNAMLCELI